MQPRALSTVPPASGADAVRQELVAVRRWPASAPFARPVPPNPDPDAATFMQPLLLPDRGMLYVSTWDGAIYTVGMATGELRDTTPWFASGEAAHLTATISR